MSVTVRIDPIDRDIALMIEEEMSPQAQSARLAAFGREHLAEARTLNAAAIGHVPPNIVFVDGRLGANEDSVSPKGVIVYEFELIGELLNWIWAQLLQHAPVLTGDYSRSFVFFADGTEVAEGQPAPAASEYVFTNVQPYTRKLERGASDQAPDGVFEAVAALASRRFGNVARIAMEHRTLPFGALNQWATLRRPSRTGASRRARRAALARDLRQPAIVVTVGR